MNICKKSLYSVVLRWKVSIVWLPEVKEIRLTKIVVKYKFHQAGSWKIVLATIWHIKCIYIDRLIQNSIALFLVFIGLGMDWSCKKADSPMYEPEVIVKSEDEPCIKFVHPVWVDEITYFDTTVEHYNEFVLKAFLKNYCTDTVKVAWKGYSMVKIESIQGFIA